MEKIETIKRIRYNGCIEEYSYLNNIQHGAQKVFYPNGKLWQLYYCNDGHNGIEEVFSDDGKRDTITQWKHSAKNGLDIYFEYGGNKTI